MDKCPSCGTDAFKHELTKFCVKCGHRIDINTCCDTKCVIHKESIQLPDHAQYCPVCKSSTTYFTNEPF